MSAFSSPLARHLLVLAPASLLLSAPSTAQEELYFEIGSGNSYLGSGVASLGDVDGDGRDDFVVGARYGTLEGRVRATSSGSGAVLWTADGQSVGGGFGYSLDSIGDLNGDGVRDILGGAPFDSQVSFRRGAVLVLSGADGSLIRRLDGDASNDHFGTSVSGAGDVDGDGVEDIVVGAPRNDAAGADAGRATVFSGATGGVLYRFDGPAPGSRSGVGVGGAGDIDGDGRDDVIVGAWWAPPQRRGTARVYSGATGGEIFRVDGQLANASLGYSVDGAGDVDGDGRDDLIIGAPNERVGPNTRAGRIYVYSGATQTLMFEESGIAVDQQFGAIVRGVGDVDGDGLDDVAAAARVLAAQGSTPPRRLAIFGRATGDTIFVAPTTGFSWTNYTSLAPAGDVNGDGFADVITGQEEWVVSFSRVGAIHVYGLRIGPGGAVCLGRPNSTGGRAAVGATSPSGFSAAANDLRFDVSGLPTSSVGYFLVSSSPSITHFPGGSAGTLCLDAMSIGRYAGNVLNSGPTGAVTFSPDLTMIPTSNVFGTFLVSANPGDSFVWQYWHRDTSASGATSNFSDAYWIEFQ